MNLIYDLNLYKWGERERYYIFLKFFKVVCNYSCIVNILDYYYNFHLSPIYKKFNYIIFNFQLMYNITIVYII